MNHIIDHIPRDTPKNRRPGNVMEADTVTIHNTGNPKSSARGERAWLTNPTNDRQASFHDAVDELGVVECLPHNENAWAAGDGNGPGNRRSIHIEICESGDYAKTLENAVQHVAKLLTERGWGVDRLRRHFDWSGKICPRLMYDEGKWTGWVQFKQRVQAAMLVKSEPKEDEIDMNVIEELERRIAKLEDRVEAPKWFINEFGSANLGGKINDPRLTAESWRVLAIGLRVK